MGESGESKKAGGKTKITFMGTKFYHIELADWIEWA